MALAIATRSMLGRFMRNTPHTRSFASLGDMDISPQMDASSTSVDAWDDFGYQVSTINRQLRAAYERVYVQVNGIYMRGSVLCFPTFTMLWDVQQVSWLVETLTKLSEA